ncbi:RAD55 family ATPase [Halegenticoccus soli]|uniref:RAD55 family ATPase n=1 Tax=Halegenticoccus soli TaxID=1985678 RepID=UPI000C6EFAF7|nr:recombinase RecA [Halegenticoccus soli]
MYDLGPPFDASVEPGTNVLVSGPPLTGKRALALDILAEGTRRNEGAIVVTTKDNASRVLDDYAERIAYAGKPVAVVDCVTRQQGIGDVRDEERVKYTSSPVDMTGIGIKLSEFLQTFYRERRVERNRIMVHSLSTLLMYSNVQTVFRFLHVFTGRVQSVDGLGLFCIDSTAHDDRTMNTLKQLFDGIVETEEGSRPALRLARD